MKKKTIITALLALIALTALGQETTKKEKKTDLLQKKVIFYPHNEKLHFCV